MIWCLKSKSDHLIIIITSWCHKSFIVSFLFRLIKFDMLKLSSDDLSFVRLDDNLLIHDVVSDTHTFN